MNSTVLSRAQSLVVCYDLGFHIDFQSSYLINKSSGFNEDRLMLYLLLNDLNQILQLYVI